MYQVRNANLTKLEAYTVYKFYAEAVCCCLQTCKCGFDIRVVQCTKSRSLLFVVVYIHVC